VHINQLLTATKNLSGMVDRWYQFNAAGIDYRVILFMFPGIKECSV